MELHSFSARGWLENEEEEEEEEGKAAALGSFVWAVSRFCVHRQLSNKKVSPGQALRSNELLEPKWWRTRGPAPTLWLL